MTMKYRLAAARLSTLAAGGLLALLAGCASAPPDARVPVADGPYGSPEAWLCRPGRDDTCAGPQATTVIAADGTQSVEARQPLPNAAIDCFYVYPTISEDPNPNSSMKAGRGEIRATAMQFAPFNSVCRTFAPMYRQLTLAGLVAVMQGKPPAFNAQMPIDDVRAAWRHYLQHDNHGRGVVLVGHSQGTRMLMELLLRDIEGKPEQQRIVSALLIGLNISVPEGKDVGGTFRQMPLCRSAGQTGCVIAFSTFRETAPPPANARFGRSNTPGQAVACVDPVALSGQPMRSMLPVKADLLGRVDSRVPEWNQKMATLSTPFVAVPGMLKAGCTRQGPNSYLALGIDPAARGSRPPEIPGDILANGRVFDDWGLHLVDMNIAMGNLLEVVRRQGEAYTAR